MSRLATIMAEKYANLRIYEDSSALEASNALHPVARYLTMLDFSNSNRHSRGEPACLGVCKWG
jgi:hypothetical protein